MAVAEPIRLTSLSHGAGCACKLGPSQLAEVLDLLGPMEIGGGEVVDSLRRIPMLTIPEVCFHDGDKPRILEKVTGEPVQSRGPA